MPHLNGKECLRALRNLRPGLRAVITSGHALDEEINDLVDEGGVTFLAKPFRIEQLSIVIKRALSATENT
jgi:DNA-binding NtrC family response regulator